MGLRSITVFFPLLLLSALFCLASGFHPHFVFLFLADIVIAFICFKIISSIKFSLKGCFILVLAGSVLVSLGVCFQYMLVLCSSSIDGCPSSKWEYLEAGLPFESIFLVFLVPASYFSVRWGRKFCKTSREITN